VIQISDVQEMLEQLSELKSIMENQEFDKYNLSDDDFDQSSMGSSFMFKIMSVLVILTVSS
jgi:hypothetical protein